MAECLSSPARQLTARMLLQVYEETGFDISGLIDEQDFIEVTSNQQRTKLYIVANVDEQVRRLWKPSCRTSGSLICHDAALLPDWLCAANKKGDQQHRVALDRGLALFRVRPWQTMTRTDGLTA